MHLHACVPAYAFELERLRVNAYLGYAIAHMSEAVVRLSGGAGAAEGQAEAAGQQAGAAEGQQAEAEGQTEAEGRSDSLASSLSHSSAEVCGGAEQREQDGVRAGGSGGEVIQRHAADTVADGQVFLIKQQLVKMHELLSRCKSPKGWTYN